jgi:hypothetical protein
MAYLIIAGLKISGDLQYPAYGEQFGVVKSSGDYSLFSVLAGCGYDLINDDTFSIPFTSAGICSTILQSLNRIL